MSGISLITKGILCSGTGDITITNKYVLPYNLEIEAQNNIDLDIKDKLNLSLNLENIKDKQFNLKLSEEQINIKTSDNSINIEE